jgi:hypothetical protein
MQHAIDEQDATRLVLLLKDLIPDYNPSSLLLRSALPIHAGLADTADIHENERIRTGVVPPTWNQGPRTVS